MSLPFLRPELAAFAAYSTHGDDGEVLPAVVDYLDTNEYPEDLPRVIKEKLTWLYQQNIQANRYPDGSHSALKDAIASYVNQSGDQSATQAQNICVGNGSDELIRSLLIATCLGKAGSILVATPTFSMYAILAETLGIPVITVPRRRSDFAVDVTTAQAALKQPAPPVRVVFMVHPNSPTANPLTDEELNWLKQLPEEVLVVVDEAYFEFSQHTTLGEALTRPNWVILRTFSKAFRLAAHRVGYSIANPELTAVLEKVRLPYNLPSVSQTAAQLVLENRQQLLAGIPTLLQERECLQNSLERMLQVWPSAANFVYVRPNVAQNAMDAELQRLFKQLKGQGTLVRLTGGGLRITVGTPEENKRTISHIKACVQKQTV